MVEEAKGQGSYGRGFMDSRAAEAQSGEDDKLVALVELGFSPEEARKGLELAGGDVSTAADWLLSGGNLDIRDALDAHPLEPLNSWGGADFDTGFANRIGDDDMVTHAGESMTLDEDAVDALMDGQQIFSDNITITGTICSVKVYSTPNDSSTPGPLRIVVVPQGVPEAESGTEHVLDLDGAILQTPEMRGLLEGCNTNVKIAWKLVSHLREGISTEGKCYQLLGGGNLPPIQSHTRMSSPLPFPDFVPDFGDQKLPPTSRDMTLWQGPTEDWQCIKCTLINKLSDSICVACGEYPPHIFPQAMEGESDVMAFGGARGIEVAAADLLNLSSLGGAACLEGAAATFMDDDRKPAAPSPRTRPGAEHWEGKSA